MPNKKKLDKKLEKLTPEEQILLRQAQDINETIQSRGWQHIANFITNSIVWPDPSVYKSREEVIMPYSEAYGASELARKLGNYVHSQDDVIKSLTAKVDEDNELPNYKIGE